MLLHLLYCQSHFDTGLKSRKHEWKHFLFKMLFTNDDRCDGLAGQSRDAYNTDGFKERVYEYHPNAVNPAM